MNGLVEGGLLSNSLFVHHGATLVADSRGVWCLLQFLIDNTLHFLLPPVLVRDLILHEGAEATGPDLVLPLAHHHP